MCYDNRDLNRTLVCTVGDLAPGQRYRTPGGDEFLITNMPRSLDPTAYTAVDLRTGCICDTPRNTKLGRDREGRLYASRYLNPPLPTATDGMTGEEANILAVEMEQ